MFDQYLITAVDKATGKTLHSETVYLFGLYMTIFVGGFMSDPFKQTAKWGYTRISKGYITKIVDKLVELCIILNIVNNNRKYKS